MLFLRGGGLCLNLCIYLGANIYRVRTFSLAFVQELCPTNYRIRRILVYFDSRDYCGQMTGAMKFGNRSNVMPFSTHLTDDACHNLIL